VPAPHLDTTVPPGCELLINPRARQLRQDKGLLARLVAEADGVAQVHVLEDLAHLQHVAAELSQRRPGRVLLCGGDGTYCECLSALHRAANGWLPAISLIPAGTVCTTARNLHGSRSLWGALRGGLGPSQVLHRHPTLLVRAAGEPERLAFTFGTGLVASFFTLYQERGASGLMTAAALVAQVFAQSWTQGPIAREVLTPLKCRLVVEGKAQSAQAYSLLLASTLEDLGLHMRVCHRAGEDPTRPHLVAVAQLSRPLAAQLWRVLRGVPLRNTDYDGLATSFEVRFEGGGPYVIDGDLHRSERLEVSAGPLISVLTAGTS
jgi:diacylglycerol kinase (ATP)